MENKFIAELEQQLTNIDLDNIKLDAIIQLKLWQKKMFSLIDKTYSIRLNEIDSIVLNISNEIKEKQNELEQIEINDKTALLKLQQEIDELKYNIVINESISDDFHHLIERTVHVKNDDDDDDLVIIDIDKPDVVILTAASSEPNQEGRVSKIFNSEPVQQALTVGLTKTLTHIGTMAATSTTTIAATTIAKTALYTTACGLGTVAYGMGRIAMGTTRKAWSLVVSSHD